MSIDFSIERWDSVKANNRAWWAGELKRPLIQFTIGGRDPGRSEPDLPSHGFHAFYDLSVSVEDIIGRVDYDLSGMKFLGDAFPTFWPNFGPGVIAAFLGACLKKSIETATVWFHPSEDKELCDIEFEYNPDNIWLNRIQDLCRAALDRWEGLVQIGMTDLGGNLDILSTFRPGEKLLLDLYDHPEQVKKLTRQAHEMWWKHFNELNSMLQPLNPGYTTWDPIFSTEPYYMLQCDFSYMIGPDMFDEFVRPELAASCKRLSNAFYHMDGQGQLPHLDSLLQIPDLKGIQWVPGWNAPDCRNWPELYRKIRDAGKLIELRGDIGLLDTVVEQLGSAEGIVFVGWISSEEEARACLKKYHVES